MFVLKLEGRRIEKCLTLQNRVALLVPSPLSSRVLVVELRGYRSEVAAMAQPPDTKKTSLLSPKKSPPASPGIAESSHKRFVESSRKRGSARGSTNSAEGSQPGDDDDDDDSDRDSIVSDFLYGNRGIN